MEHPLRGINLRIQYYPIRVTRPTSLNENIY